MLIRFEGGVLHGKALEFADPPAIYYGTLLDAGIERRSTYVLDRWELDGQANCAYRDRELTNDEIQQLRATALKN